MSRQLHQGNHQSYGPKSNNRQSVYRKVRPEKYIRRQSKYHISNDLLSTLQNHQKNGGQPSPKFNYRNTIFEKYNSIIFPNDSLLDHYRFGNSTLDLAGDMVPEGWNTTLNGRMTLYVPNRPVSRGNTIGSLNIDGMDFHEILQNIERKSGQNDSGDAICDSNNIFWLDINNPTLDELQALADTFDIHPLSIENILYDLPTADKYEAFKTYDFICYRALIAKNHDQGENSKNSSHGSNVRKVSNPAPKMFSDRKANASSFRIPTPAAKYGGNYNHYNSEKISASSSQTKHHHYSCGGRDTLLKKNGRHVSPEIGKFTSVGNHGSLSSNPYYYCQSLPPKAATFQSVRSTSAASTFYEQRHQNIPMGTFDSYLQNNNPSNNGNDQELSDEKSTPLFIIILPQGIITCHHTEVDSIRQTMARLSHEQHDMPINPHYIAYTILDDVTEEVLPLSKSMEVQTGIIDELVFHLTDKEQTQLLNFISSQRRQVLWLLRVLHGKKEVVKGLERRVKERARNSVNRAANAATVASAKQGKSDKTRSNVDSNKNEHHCLNDRPYKPLSPNVPITAVASNPDLLQSSIDSIEKIGYYLPQIKNNSKNNDNSNDKANSSNDNDESNSAQTQQVYTPWTVWADLSRYLNDIYDHIEMMATSVHQCERILSRANANYMSRVNLQMSIASQKTNKIVGRLTFVTVLFLPMNLVTGIWNMNIQVPGQGQENLNWFFGLNGFMALIAIVYIYFMWKYNL
ncbi:Mg(2+) transporter [Mycoemilia scoparia]|uniref:Mg(2+) transporter n=1 Tax=Mycoemilia scoparia TaxID=417184 RepID=A0A9W7ZUL2_9FUNG|nr:Mg(2+) transporter [Mycoemilia scoparia]